jgi:predicted oxidoreductase (fatty acid repression mutant protein)
MVVYGDNMETKQIYDEIDKELGRAMKHGPHFTNLHEAYAVILEEFDEVWDIVKQKQSKRDPIELKKELVQVGAMVVKALTSPIFNTFDGYYHIGDEE